MEEQKLSKILNIVVTSGFIFMFIAFMIAMWGVPTGQNTTQLISTAAVLGTIGGAMIDARQRCILGAVCGFCSAYCGASLVNAYLLAMSGHRILVITVPIVWAVGALSGVVLYIGMTLALGLVFRFLNKKASNK